MKKKFTVLLAALSLSFLINPSNSYASENLVESEKTTSIESDISKEETEFVTTSDLEVEENEDNNLFSTEEVEIEDDNEVVSSNYSILEDDESDQEDQDIKVDEDLSESKEEPLKEIYYYVKLDLDKTYLGEKIESSDIGRDLTVISKGKEANYKNKWVKMGDEIHYIDKDGKKVEGFHKFGKDTYFFSDKGLVVNDKVARDSGIYKIDQTGRLSYLSKAKPGWLDLNGKSYYYNARGELLKGLQEVNNNRYVFNPKTGQVEKEKISKIGNEKYYSADNGLARRIGWDYYNGHYAYVKQDGSYSKGLTSVSNRHYFFDNTGNMMTDTNRKVGNQWWYFDFFGEGRKTNGNFKKGWYGDYYYFQDGKRARGYQTINGKLYYFDDRYFNKRKNFDGAYDFKAYHFDANGVGRFTGNISKKRHKSGVEGFNPGQTRYTGRKTPYYSQRDPRWAGRPFARTNSNFASMGCGSTAMAMALSRVKNDPGIYPTTVAKDAWYYTNWEGTEWEFIPDEAIRYGLKAHSVPINQIALAQALREGPVVVRVGPGAFINAGHFMVIDSYSNGYFNINDPYYWHNTAGKHSFSKLKGSATTAWLIK